jgi:nardilysin
MMKMKIQIKFTSTAFDRFTDMVTRPLFSKDAMQREREAVDSEFQMATSEIQERETMVLRSFFKESHPAGHFDWGNLKTLKDDISDDDLHAAMLRLFKKYVARKMVLCVQSSKSLDEMQSLVVAKFASIASGDDDENIPEFNIDELVKPEFFEKVLHVQPQTPTRRLSLTWILPPQIAHSDCEPFKYLRRIFDNADEGGLVNWLKERNLATSFTMQPEILGDIDFNRHFAMLKVVTELTDNGKENLELVLEAIFSYLLFLKETPIDEHKRFFEQYKRQLQVNFRFTHEKPVAANVSLISSRAFYYRDIDLLRAASAVEFNEHAIMDVINRLNELRFAVTITDDKRMNYSKREQHFGVEYDDVEVPESYRRLWANRSVKEEFSLPKDNPFEPMNFDISVNAAESPVGGIIYEFFGFYFNFNLTEISCENIRGSIIRGLAQVG